MQNDKKSIQIIWFRKDLRLGDNDLLQAAMQKRLPCVAVFYWPSHWLETNTLGLSKMGGHRKRFLAESLACLRTQLETYNIPLLVTDAPEDLSSTLAAKYVVENLWYHEDTTFEEAQEAQKVLSFWTNETKIWPLSRKGLFLKADCDKLIKKQEFSFSAFRKKVEKYLVVRATDHYSLTVQEPLNLEGLNGVLREEEFLETTSTIPDDTAFPFRGGELSVLDRLHGYLFENQHVKTYEQTRNGLLGTEYSTKFSPWLALGNISAATIVETLKKYEREYGANESTYWVYFELLWREYFKVLAEKNGTTFFQKYGFRTSKQSFPKASKEIFQLWIEGKTEDEFVNANMNELRSTGWMSNRGRQNVASYWIHDLQGDWRWGAAYFEMQLIDYDVHSNYGNWQYIAGIGIDGKPKHFDIQQQASYYDKNGEFRARWS